MGSLLAVQLIAGILLINSFASASAQEDWKLEFEDACRKTQTAMALSAEELTGLIDRCNKLHGRLHELKGSEKKVYAKRLEMCRDLYVFALDVLNRKE